MQAPEGATPMLDSDLLTAYMKGFFGYGNYTAPYWFIGMEEGGGGDFDNVQRRLLAWERFGRKETLDIAAFHREIGMPGLFNPPLKLQHTWSRLIRVLLSAKDPAGCAGAKEDLLTLQATFLARDTKDNETCLLELMPLPSQSMKTWKFDKWSSVECLKTRKEYERRCRPKRMEALRRRIKEHKPKVVVFYSLGLRNFWGEVAGIGNPIIPPNGIMLTPTADTLFVIIKHPAARASNAYFNEAGRQIAPYI